MPGGVLLRFAPNDPEVLQRLQDADFDPRASHSGVWWVAMNDALPFSREMDPNIPEGAIVPSIVLLQSLDDDRDDVAAVGTWKNGFWNMEVRRPDNCDFHDPVPRSGAKWSDRTVDICHPANALIGFGAYELGVPVLSMIAGFGIGGIAVALAVRPTLENLIGGFVLFLDKPVRVGDYCTFGDQSGTVEAIGVRSTQLRAIDRTQISIPNAQFADMQIVNWARCDTMLIRETLGLRFETDAEQMRHVLAKIREMLHSHPRIEAETIRVRFVGYGDSSKNVDLRIYAKTREWNDFYSIREDILLRIDGIVEASGTGFAFPSQTLYWSRDPGLDAERTEQAHQEVATWRRQRQLPFLRFSSTALEGLSGKLKYPPPGSPDYLATNEELAEGGEMLSADQPQEPGSEKNLDEKPGKSGD